MKQNNSSETHPLYKGDMVITRKGKPYLNFGDVVEDSSLAERLRKKKQIVDVPTNFGKGPKAIANRQEQMREEAAKEAEAKKAGAAKN
jgi:hypothetical protein